MPRTIASPGARAIPHQTPFEGHRHSRLTLLMPGSVRADTPRRRPAPGRCDCAPCRWNRCAKAQSTLSAAWWPRPRLRTHRAVAARNGWKARIRSPEWLRAANRAQHAARRADQRGDANVRSGSRLTGEIRTIFAWISRIAVRQRAAPLSGKTPTGTPVHRRHDWLYLPVFRSTEAVRPRANNRFPSYRRAGRRLSNTR